MTEKDEKYARWHERQFELGACNCRGCKARRSGKEAEAVAAAGALESHDVAVGGDAQALAAAPPAPHPDGELLRFDKRAGNPLAPPRGAGNPYRHFRDAVKPGEPAPDNENDVPFLLPIDERSAPGVVFPMRGEGWQTVEYSADGFVLRYNKLLPERVSFIRNEKLAWQEKLDRAKARAAAQAVQAKLSYEEARARLEAEFGTEAVGKAIDGLTRLLAIRDDVDRLADRAAALSDDAVELRESLIDLRGKLDADE